MKYADFKEAARKKFKRCKLLYALDCSAVGLVCYAVIVFDKITNNPKNRTCFNNTCWTFTGQKIRGKIQGEFEFCTVYKDQRWYLEPIPDEEFWTCELEVGHLFLHLEKEPFVEFVTDGLVKVKNKRVWKEIHPKRKLQLLTPDKAHEGTDLIVRYNNTGPTWKDIKDTKVGDTAYVEMNQQTLRTRIAKYWGGGDGGGGVASMKQNGDGWDVTRLK